MAFPGLPKDEDVANVIAYLKQFGPDGEAVRRPPLASAWAQRGFGHPPPSLPPQGGGDTRAASRACGATLIARRRLCRRWRARTRRPRRGTRPGGERGPALGSGPTWATAPPCLKRQPSTAMNASAAGTRFSG